MKTGIIIGLLIVVGIIYLISRNNHGNNQKTQVARQIRLVELESLMTQLLERKLEYDFFGITSDGVDCIYFANKQGLINIEFEVMTNEQRPYVERFNFFAKQNNIKITKMSYGNKPLYPELKEAPVYKLELKADRHRATKIGREILKEIFNKTDKTIFDVIP